MQIGFSNTPLCCIKIDVTTTNFVFVLTVVTAKYGMYCDLCQTRKLRREFPSDTITDKCEHAPLHCLRVSCVVYCNLTCSTWSEALPWSYHVCIMLRFFAFEKTIYLEIWAKRLPKNEKDQLCSSKTSLLQVPLTSIKIKFEHHRTCILRQIYAISLLTSRAMCVKLTRLYFRRARERDKNIPEMTSRADLHSSFERILWRDLKILTQSVKWFLVFFLRFKAYQK